MIRIKSILLLTLTVVSTLLGNPFSFYKGDMELNEAKNDSFFVVDPVIRISMYKNDVDTVNVENRFNFYIPDYKEDAVEIADTTFISAAEQTIIDGRLYISITSKDTIGRTELSYTVYPDSLIYVDSLYDKSVTDTFTVSVEDPAFQWIEWGSIYNPQHTLGTKDSSWKAATYFSFDTDSIYLKEIEFGFLEEEMVEWKLVEFDGVPTDIIWGDMSDSILCSAAKPTYIDHDYFETNSIDSTYFTGEVALVFSSDGNFMTMDPNGTSSNTWIYADVEDFDHWQLAINVNGAYHGAWYMRLQVFNLTTSSIQTHYSGTISNFDLHQNYPNPFNPTTEINFTLNHNSFAKLKVFNSNGEVVKTLCNGRLVKGYHSFNFDGQDLNSGLYFYQLAVDGVRSTRKMILMK